MSWEFSLRLAATVLGLAIAIVLLYDLVVYARYGDESTISHGVWILSLRYRVIPWAFVSVLSFLLGFLTCHFFG